MGNHIPLPFGHSKSPSVRIALLGLDGSGKTSILHRLKYDEFILKPSPTIGFNIETIFYNKKVNLTLLDVGGSSSLRALWKYYYSNVDGIIFVIDSFNNDGDIIEETKDEIHCLFKESNLQVILILANKQDLLIEGQEFSIEEQFGGLKNNDSERVWTVMPCSAKTGDGIAEGIDWLLNAMQQQKKKPRNSRPLEESIVRRFSQSGTFPIIPPTKYQSPLSLM